MCVQHGLQYRGKQVVDMVTGGRSVLVVSSDFDSMAAGLPDILVQLLFHSNHALEKSEMKKLDEDN